MVNKHTKFIPPCPHDGGGRFGRTIASGQRFAFLRAAADAAIADYVCSRCSVARLFANATCGMRYHSADQVNRQLLAGLLQTLGVLGNLQLVNALLNVTIHKHRKIVHRPVDTMVSHTRLRIIVRTDLR